MSNTNYDVLLDAQNFSDSYQIVETGDWWEVPRLSRRMKRWSQRQWFFRWLKRVRKERRSWILNTMTGEYVRQEDDSFWLDYNWSVAKQPWHDDPYYWIRRPKVSHEWQHSEEWGLTDLFALDLSVDAGIDADDYEDDDCDVCDDVCRVHYSELSCEEYHRRLRAARDTLRTFVQRQFPGGEMLDTLQRIITWCVRKAPDWISNPVTAISDVVKILSMKIGVWTTKVALQAYMMDVIYVFASMTILVLGHYLGVSTLFIVIAQSILEWQFSDNLTGASFRTRIVVDVVFLIFAWKRSGVQRQGPLDLLPKLAFLLAAIGFGHLVPSTADVNSMLLKFDRIPKAITGVAKMAEMIQEAYDYAADVFYEKIYGEQRLRESAIPRECVENRDKAFSFDVDRVAEMPSRPDLCEDANALYVQYHQLRDRYRDNRVVKEYLNAYAGNVRDIFQKAASSNPKPMEQRVKPVSVFLYGGSAVGKSNLINFMAADILKREGVLRAGDTDEECRLKMNRCVYARAREQEFWDGYMNQLVTVYDDVFQLKDAVMCPNLEFFELIRSINTFPYPLHKADLSEKANSFFSSKFLFGTTNVKSVHCPSLNERNAVLSRMHCNYAVRVKQQYRRNPEVMFQWGAVDQTPYAIDPERVRALTGSNYSLDVYEIFEWDPRTGNIGQEPIFIDALCEIIWNKHVAHNSMKEDSTQMIMNYVRRELADEDGTAMSQSDKLFHLILDPLLVRKARYYLSEIAGYQTDGLFRFGVSMRERRGDKTVSDWYFELMSIIRVDAMDNDQVAEVKEVFESLDWMFCVTQKLAFCQFIRVIECTLNAVEGEYRGRIDANAEAGFPLDMPIEAETQWRQAVFDLMQEGVYLTPTETSGLANVAVGRIVRRQAPMEMFAEVGEVYADKFMETTQAVRYVYERIQEDFQQEFIELAQHLEPRTYRYGGDFVTELQHCQNKNGWLSKAVGYFKWRVGFTRTLNWNRRIDEARARTELVAQRYADRTKDFIERHGMILTALGVITATLGVAYLAFYRKVEEPKIVAREMSVQQKSEIPEEYNEYEQYYLEELDSYVVIIKDDMLANGQSFSISSSTTRLCFMTESYFDAACELEKSRGDKLTSASEIKQVKCGCSRETGPSKTLQQTVKYEAEKVREAFRETGPQKDAAQARKYESGPQKNIVNTVKLETGPVKEVKTAVRFENAASVVRESWHSTQASELSAKVQDNYGWICDESGSKVICPVVNIVGSFAIVVNHYWEAVPEKFTYAPPRCKVGKYHFTKQQVFVKNVRRMPDRPSDVTLLQWPRVVPKCPNILKNFVTKKELSDLKLKKFVLVSPGLRQIGDDQHQFQFHFKRGTVTAINDGMRCGGGLTTWALDIESLDCPSAPGDCGGLYIADENTIRGRILAMHYAGGVETAGAIGHILVFEDFEFILKEEEIERQSPVGEEEAFELPLQGVMPMYMVGRAPSQPTVSAYEPTPIKGEVDDTEMEPVKLGRILEEGGPGLKGLQKVTGPVKSLDPVLYERSVQSFSGVAFSGTSHLEIEKRVLTFDEAVRGVEGTDFVRGINRARSPGYPWMMERGGTTGKRKWFGSTEWELGESAKPVREAVEKKIQQCKEGIWEPVIFVDTLKDECRPKGKKTRVFSAGPMHFTIAFRMFFLGFVSYLMRNRIHNEIGVGIQAQSMDWHHLALRLQRKGPAIVAGDFSDYDGNLHPEFLWAFCDMANRWYSDGNDLIRKTLFCDIVHSWHLAGNYVYGWTHSQPSGNPVTSIVNSVANSIMCRYVFYLLEAQQEEHYNFNTAVQMISYGDDNVLNIRQDVLPWYNQLTMSKAFETIGMTYTDANKEEVQRENITIHEASFLKRGFRFHNDIWLGPLERKSINNRLEWQKRGMDRDTLIENGRAAIAEWALHDSKDFQHWKKRIQDVFLDKLNVNVEAYSQEFYIAQVRAGKYPQIFPGLEYI